MSNTTHHRRLRGAARHAAARRRPSEKEARRAYEASLRLVAKRRGVDPKDARRHRASLAIVEVKQLALYLATTCFGVELRPVSRAASISAPGALKAVRKVEDRRDDPLFDRVVGDFEMALMGAV